MVWFNLTQRKIFWKVTFQKWNFWLCSALIFLTFIISLFLQIPSHAADNFGYLNSVNLLLLSNGPGSGTCDDDDVTNDIPFSYTFTPNHIVINTLGGILKTFIGPWGAHTPPHTGHNDGGKKANWSGLFATRYDELTELEGMVMVPARKARYVGCHRARLITASRST